MSQMRCETKEYDGGSSCRMHLSGALNVGNAQAVCQCVLSNCEKYSRVGIVLEDVTAFDASVMQILLAAQRIETAGVSIFRGSQAESVEHWLNIAGLREMLPLHAV